MSKYFPNPEVYCFKIRSDAERSYFQDVKIDNKPEKVSPNFMCDETFLIFWQPTGSQDTCVSVEWIPWLGCQLKINFSAASVLFLLMLSWKAPCPPGYDNRFRVWIWKDRKSSIHFTINFIWCQQHWWSFLLYITAQTNPISFYWSIIENVVLFIIHCIVRI